MGYANPEQTAGGIHTRLFSRAFIVDDGSKRVVFVSAEIGMISQRLRLEVLKELELKYGDLYRQDNVVLSGTHTHAGLAGYFQYTLFMITSKGYIKSSIQPIVSGIVKSIDLAHRNMRPGRIFINKGELLNNTRNRSPHSYMRNPEEERKRYQYDTDKQVVTLKFTDLDGDGIGMLSWFAVHSVSMHETNKMVSSDNLGYAAYLFEQDKNIGFLPGKGPFVAALASANSGDASPNTRGPYCINTGERCDYLNSSCPIGGNEMCLAFGLGEDMFESTRLIAENIYKKTKELYSKAEQELQGSIHAAHQSVNMTDITIQLNSTHTGKTCKPALGHSFAAGTTDGGGALNFTQGKCSVEGDPFWDSIRDALTGVPSQETQDCHVPKPILFNTGELDWPVPWHPAIVDVQIITIGSLAIVAVPGEVTTMSGRRIREAVKQELETQGAFTNAEVVVAGLCNVYTHYITTYEEYQVQRYEAASTIYGPHTLSAYIQQFRGLARAIAQGNVGNLPKGPEPPFFNKLFTLLPDTPIDRKPENTAFGQVLQQADAIYKVGELVNVTFVAGNPRNSGDMRDQTFITVEKFHNSTNTWEVVHTDASWETRSMARKAVWCGLSSLELLFMVLFLLMTVVTVGLITVLAINFNSQTQEPEEPIPSAKPSENPFLIGVGRADCTGPVGDIPLMGYANAEQTAAGIHTRLFSRAFIVDDGSKRVVFVNADIGMASQRLRLEVLKELQLKYGDLYRQDNVIISGTHTHSGLAGYFQYTLFMITSKGYIKSSIQPIVSGIVKSIERAHNSMRPGRIFVNKGETVGSNFNRSPHSYLNNPEEERQRYKSNTDEQIVTLKFTDLDGDGIGSFSWFAVHAVSMNYTNRMVSSDNLGYASYLFEQEKNIGSFPGEGPFVAAFATGNSGDASPNTRGPYCVNTGEKCDYLNSSCPIGGTKMCVAFGPGDNMFESTRIVGENIYKKAKELYSSAEQELQGSVHAAHQWVNMTDVTVQLNSTHSVGAVEGDPFWDGIRDALLGAPSKEIQDCQNPKPILFSTGEMNWPLPWHPAIVDVQIITIGSLAIVAVPGEATTMSGRRIREAVKQELEKHNAFTNPEVVITGLCNAYTHYITTYEEYQVQRYEGASTIYGPHTLSAYIQHFRGLAKAIAEARISRIGKVEELPKGPEPPFFSNVFSLLADAPVDKKPENTTFGQVLDQVQPVYKVGEVVSVTFVAGNPRNSGDMRDKTFITVEKFHDNTGAWEVVHTDASWETR
ncbi:hypothetical protein NFI96_016251 [Prochilodus magdalenae]|nr:hypothetical protein NFI96_016251 [Prochilodus magdalenae]